MTLYVVHKGRKTGIFKTWNECKKQTDHFDGAIFKKFEDNDKEEALKFFEIGFGEGKKPRSLVRKENDDIKNKAIIDDVLEESSDNIIIYTDGSCIKVKKGLFKACY